MFGKRKRKIRENCWDWSWGWSWGLSKEEKQRKGKTAHEFCIFFLFSVWVCLLSSGNVENFVNKFKKEENILPSLSRHSLLHCFHNFSFCLNMNDVFGWIIAMEKLFSLFSHKFGQPVNSFGIYSPFHREKSFIFSIYWSPFSHMRGCVQIHILHGWK